MISASEAALKLNVSARRIRALCEQGRIPGAEKVGAYWVLPDRLVVIEAERKRPSKIMKKKISDIHHKINNGV